MKTFTRMAAQGDFIIMKVAEIPEDMIPLELENDVFIIAHSETGHNHVMERTHVSAYRAKDVKDVDLYELFLVVKEPTRIDHLRAHDTHEALLVPPGNYKIRRQREYTSEGFRRAAD